jgi:hypothetical protein
MARRERQHRGGFAIVRRLHPHRFQLQRGSSVIHPIVISSQLSLSAAMYFQHRIDHDIP